MLTKTDRAAALAEAYERDGYATADNVFTQEDIAELRGLLVGLIDRFQELESNWRVRDMGATGDTVPGTQQPEIDRSAKFEPALLETAVYRKAKALADELLGKNTSYAFDHVICKMPNGDTPTHWHQDTGYMIPGVQLNTINFWIPVQDVTKENGAMRYIPGSHRELITHSTREDLNEHILTLDVDESEAVTCDTSVGGLILHHPLSIHGAWPNRSDQARLIWSLHLGALGRFEYFHPRNWPGLLNAAIRRSKRAA